MVPVVVGKAFCWFHDAPGDVGVVICPGLGRDLRHAYRTLYLMAEMLAGEGYPVLRLQYSNTGNSDDEYNADYFEVCLKNVRDAFDWMKAKGIVKTVLFGFRFGALLIANLEDRRAQACIAVQPVTSGRKYLRELQVANGLHGFPNPGAGQVWENEDLCLRPEDRISIAQRAGSIGRSHDPLTLTVSGDGPEGSLPSSEMNVEGAADVSFIKSTFYNAIMESYEDVKIPTQELAEICAWLKRNLPSSARQHEGEAVDGAVLHGATWREYAVEVVSKPAMRGMLCEPAGLKRSSSTALIIGNLGWDPQFGMGRFNVQLARRLASEGVSVLRIDYLGLGDSDDLPAGQRNLIYATPRDREFKAAIDWMEARGFTNIGLAGHCSGAFYAFQAALKDKRVKFAFLVNVVCLKWSFQGSYAEYLRSAGKRFDDYVKYAMRALKYWPARIMPHKPMRSLAQRGAKIWFISGENDLTRRDVEHLFRPRRNRTKTYENIKFLEVPKVDHMLSTEEMRCSVVSSIAAELNSPVHTQITALRSRDRAQGVSTA